MLQKFRTPTGLNRLYSGIPIKDTTVNSSAYFRVFDIPDRFYLGKNTFRLRANLNNLVPNSMVYIDIIDSEGNAVYHEIVDFIGEDESRIVVVQDRKSVV